MTVGKSHGVKAKRLKDILELLKLAEDEKIPLYFIVCYIHSFLTKVGPSRTI
jgi:hypothetical protein